MRGVAIYSAFGTSGCRVYPLVWLAASEPAILKLEMFRTLFLPLALTNKVLVKRGEKWQWGAVSHIPNMLSASTNRIQVRGNMWIAWDGRDRRVYCWQQQRGLVIYDNYPCPSISDIPAQTISSHLEKESWNRGTDRKLWYTQNRNNTKWLVLNNRGHQGRDSLKRNSMSRLRSTFYIVRLQAWI